MSFIPSAGAAAMAGLTGAQAGDLIGVPLADAAARMGGGGAKAVDDLLAEKHAAGEQDAAEMLRMQRLQRGLAQNIDLLARKKPGLLQELAAGRRLPRGAIVIGGRPRMDLVEEAGRQMGAYTPPQDPLSGV